MIALIPMKRAILARGKRCPVESMKRKRVLARCLGDDGGSKSRRWKRRMSIEIVLMREKKLMAGGGDCCEREGQVELAAWKGKRGKGEKEGGQRVRLGKSGIGIGALRLVTYKAPLGPSI